jgi:hypothetical protein
MICLARCAQKNDPCTSHQFSPKWLRPLHCFQLIPLTGGKHHRLLRSSHRHLRLQFAQLMDRFTLFAGPRAPSGTTAETQRLGTDHVFRVGESMPNAITSGLTNHVDLLIAKAPLTARVSKHGREVAPRDDNHYFPFAGFRNLNFFEWQHRGRPRLSKTQRSHNIRTHKLQSVGLRKCIRQAVMSSTCPEG